MVTHPPPQIQTKKLKRDFSCQTSSHKFKCGLLFLWKSSDVSQEQGGHIQGLVLAYLLITSCKHDS